MKKQKEKKDSGPKQVPSVQKHPAVTRPKPDKTSLIILAAILVLTFISFSNSIRNGFTNWDDQVYITTNKLITDLSVAGVQNMFSTASVYSNNYHPLTALSNAIEYHFFGLNPAVYHFDNLLLHLFNVVLVFVFFILLTGKKEVALIVAALFAVHPMHVESVSWVSERKDVLYSFFYLLALIGYLTYRQNGYKSKYLIYTGIAFLLAMFSKSAAVTLPVVLLLLDYYADRKLSLKTIAEKVPFLILSLVFGKMAIASQASTLTDTYLTPVFSTVDRLFLVSYGVVRYIFELFIPVQLSALHPYPQATDGTLPFIYYLAPVFILLLVALVLAAKKYRKDLAFGLLFFIITISLTLQIVPVGQAIIAERYTYIPYLGLFFIVAVLSSKLQIKGSKLFSHLPSFSVSPFIALLLIVYVFAFSLLTFERNKVWNNSRALWADVIEKYPTAASAYYNLGEIKLNDGFDSLAIPYFTKAVENNPRHYKAYVNRGNAFLHLKNYPEAIQDYDKSIALNPLFGLAYNSRATAKFYMKDAPGACQDWYQASKLDDPDGKRNFQSFCK